MTNRVRSLAAGAVVLLMLNTATGAHGQQASAILEMATFLESWLVHDNMNTTVSHFGGSDQSLSLAPTYLLDFARYVPDVVGTAREVAREYCDAASPDVELPPGVAFGYWRLLHGLWADAGRVDTRLEDLLVVEQQELIDFLDENFDVVYVQKSPFIVFYADDRAELDAFDAGFAEGGYGQLANVLKPSEDHPILTMIADFRFAQSRNGPLVAFWDEEVSHRNHREWRIQALGAFPEH